MSKPSDVVDVIRAIAAGAAVDWTTVGATPADDSVVSVLNELQVIARIAEVHGSTGDVALVDEDADDRLQSWGPLTVIDRVGAGSYGVVYRAWDSRLDREVALKLLRRPDAPLDADTPTVEEGRVLARVRHPNVVTIYGADRIDGRVGLWMEFIEGRTLAAIVNDEGPLDAEPAARIGIDICAALAAVHACGMVHGDVKAQNVMRDDAGRTVLMDFGTGHVAEESACASRLEGTPLYLAPEVLNGAVPDLRSDVYSAGVLLYHLLTGTYPVDGRTLDEVRAAQARGARTRVRDRRADVPPSLAAVVDRAIAPDPASRFETATAFEHALDAATGRREPATWRRAMLSGMAAVLVVAVVGSGWRKPEPVKVKAPAETVTAASADSLRLYYRSYELSSRNDWNSALAVVQQAISADPTFALAHTWKAWCLYNLEAAPDDVVAEGRRAVEMSSRVSEWERLWIDASYDFFTGNADEEIAALTALVKLRPDHVWAVNNLARRLSTVGRDHDAVPYAVQVANLRPTEGAAVALAARVLMTAGETDKALEYAHRVRVMVDEHGWFGGAYNAWLLPIEALWRRGDLRAAADALDAARTDCAQLNADYRFNLAQYLVTANLSLGRWRAARDAADVMPDPNQRHFNRAIVAFHAGDHKGWEHEMNLVSNGGFEEKERSFYLLQAGKVDAAEWEVDHAAIGMDPGGLRVARGRIALARGNRRQALALLESAQPSPHVMDSIARFEDVAKLYLEQGDRPRAILALQESLNYRSIPFLSMWWMRTELRLAELYHASGRDIEARPLEAELDRLLVAADPDFPLVVRLKALEAKTPAPAVPAVAFRQRDWALITTFENRTGDRQFDHTIEHALEYELTNSAYVNLVPPDRIDDALRLMKRPSDTVITATIGREIAERDGAIRVVVDGTIDRVGTGYAITVRAVNPGDGAVMASDREDAPTAGAVQTAIRRTSNWIRVTLGEAPLAVKQSDGQLAKVTTPSLHAVTLFTEARRAFDLSHFTEAEALLSSALAEDPNFASAHVWMAWTFANLQRPHEAVVASARRAFDLAGSTTEHERYWILASYYRLTDDNRQALGPLEVLARRFPDDSWALQNLSRVYAALGRNDQAVELYLRLADVRPNDFQTQALAAEHAVQWQNLSAARPLVDRARRLLTTPTKPLDFLTVQVNVWILLFPAHDLWASGHPGEAAKVLNMTMGRPEFTLERNWTWTMVGKLRLALGQLREAEEAFNHIDDPGQRALMKSELALARGDAQAIVASLAGGQSSDLAAVSLLVRAADVDAAERVLSGIRNGPSDHLEWAGKEIEEARGSRTRITEALKTGAPWTRVMTGARASYYSETLARAAAQAGDVAGAIRFLEENNRSLGPRAYAFFTQSGFEWMRTQKLLADLYRQTGQTDDARAIESDLLKQLTVADPDYPLLVELKKLQGTKP